MGHVYRLSETMQDRQGALVEIMRCVGMARYILLVIALAVLLPRCAASGESPVRLIGCLRMDKQHDVG